MLIDAWPVVALFVFCAACVLGVHFYTIRQAKRRGGGAAADPSRPVVLYESTRTDEKARVEALLPTTASEDVSHLIDIPECGRPVRVIDGVYELVPDEQSDWVIDVVFNTPTSVPETTAIGVLNSKPPRAGIFGIEVRTGLWTGCGSGRANGEVLNVNRLALEKTMFVGIPDDETPTVADLNEFLQTMTERARGLGDVVLRPRCTPEEAVARARRRREFYEAEIDGFNDVGIILRAPGGAAFSGREIWDVMLCLGIEWGDMDIFHCLNMAGEGDDNLFSVWTTTPPGYFFPESVARGQEYADLVFGLNIARTCTPAVVFDAMMKAARYAQKRLGGEIVDEHGRPADEAAIRARIDARAQYLEQAGCAPGTDAALRMF
ncbi:MAG: cell division protein ZipA C-terminal FtsZ-binding domain-containing protein [Candidatus Sumerlaeia bacterium]